MTILPTDDIVEIESHIRESDATMLRWMTYNSQNGLIYSCVLTVSLSKNENQKLVPYYKFESFSAKVPYQPLTRMLQCYSFLTIIGVLLLFRVILQVVIGITNSALMYFEMAQLAGVIAALSFLIHTSINLGKVSASETIDHFLEETDFHDLQSTERTFTNFNLSAMFVLVGTPLRIVYWIGV